MPLHDSLGASSIIRLGRLHSVPSTEDLRYALTEAKRQMGKTIEMEFDQPSNRLTFIVKLVLSPGKAPSWTLQQGDGPGGKRVWVRSSEDVLMIQNKIKIDSQSHTVPGIDEPTVRQEDSQAGDGPPSPQKSAQKPSQPIILGGPIGGKTPSAPPPAAPDQDGGMPQWNPGDTGPAPATLAAFFSNGYPAPLDAFLAQPQPPPTVLFGTPDAPSTVPPSPGSTAASVPGSSSMPGSRSGAASSSAPTSGAGSPSSSGSGSSSLPGSSSVPAPPHPKVTAIPKMSGASEETVPFALPNTGQAQTAAPPAPPKLPLPAPIKLDTQLVNNVHRLLADPNSGHMSFQSFVFFLFREFARFQKDGSPLAVVIFEIAIRLGAEVAPPTPQALSAVAQRIRTVSSPLDMVTYVSGGEFAVLLPSTNGSAALDFAIVLNEALSGEPLLPEYSQDSLLAAIGIAAIPDTCNHPELLIAAARQAKEMAKGSATPYLLFPA